MGFYKTNLKQGAHIHQPTAWPVPHACAQPYHPGSGSHGQLFRPYWGSSAWHSRRVNEQGKSPCIKDPLLRIQVQALLKVTAPHNTCGNCWLRTARQFSHGMRGEGGRNSCPWLPLPRDMAVRMREVQARPWVGVCVPLALSLSYGFL